MHKKGYKTFQVKLQFEYPKSNFVSIFNFVYIYFFFLAQLYPKSNII